MNGPILVAYASKHGSTEHVAAAIAARLREAGVEVELERADHVAGLERYAGAVLGGSLYMGRWHREVVKLLRRDAHELAERPTAVFALGPQTLEPHDVEASRKQLLAALAKAPAVKPFAVAIFGGVIDPHTFRFPLNRLAASDARDWDAVDAFAVECARTFGYGKPAETARDPRTELQRSPR